MKIRVGTLLPGLENEILRHPDTEEAWTVGLVLIQAALGVPAKGETFTEDEHIARRQIAVDTREALHQMQDGDLEATVDIPIEMIVKLKADIMRSFGSIIAGQISPHLNG